ncbi:phosphatidylserine decarboxylase [Elasticomyces elasticus]|nr:phosphatidylserine decarboxylase [Elasticomyces elasticus]
MFSESYSQWTTMPNDDTTREQAKDKRSLYDTLFSIPPPLKHIFDRTPLVTYAANELPSRSPKNRSRNVLHVFTSPEDAQHGRPSFNPACLKWQTYLKVHGIDFQTVESNNHASPSGSLPFLIAGETGEVVAGNKLKRWVATQKKGEKTKEVEDVRYEAYTSLLDHRIRRAWLYQLYLQPSNASLLHDLYRRPCSSNPFVQMTIAHQLRSAAMSEILKSNPSSSPSHPTIDEAEIMGDAEEAFAALAELLGGKEWFFGVEKPALFDASVHAYLELLIGKGMQWKENRLGEMVKKYEGLVKHRERVKEMYF